MTEERSGLEAALDELLKGKKTEEIVGPNGLLKQLTKALLERAMNAELTHHLGYEKGQAEGRGSGNNRQRQQPEEGAGRLRPGRDRSAARPQRKLRAADSAQARASLDGLRRQDCFDVCARHEHARH